MALFFLRDFSCSTRVGGGVATDGAMASRRQGYDRDLN
jgi:hypothetical protein